MPEETWLYLTQAEARFVNAAIARLIPTDELGPGAQEAGVACFIDRQLAGAWGAHSRAYRMGPWREGTPQQGYQLPLTPRDIYRAAILEIDAHCAAQRGKPFHALPPDQQDEILHALEDGVIELPTAPSPVFFAFLWRNTLEGFFADPIHGGNRDKIGWRLIGFPGVAAADYAARLEHHGEPYHVEPVSILDITQDRARLDPQGYPRHKPRSDAP